MFLERLAVRNFRNYATCEATFAPGLILIAGPNAAGKTNFLEAIHVACSGISPRARRDAELVRWEEDRFQLQARVVQAGARHDIAVGYLPEQGKRVRVNGSAVQRRTDLLDYAAAVLFTPDDLRLIKGAPARRRRFLDRVTVLLDRRHAADLVELRNVLEQRNQVLRDVRSGRSGGTLAGLFDDTFASCAARVLARRMRALRLLEQVAAPLLKVLGADETLALSYLERGELHRPATQAVVAAERWHELALARLEQLAAEERERGQTLWGPQRDDVAVGIGGRDARTYASQGQQRSLVLALKFAEAELAQRSVGSPPLLLLDDVLSELDAARSEALLQIASRHEQAFLTATGVAAPIPRDAAVYRVRGGVLEEESA